MGFEGPFANRNRAAFTLGLTTGYRAREMMSLRFRDICDFESGELYRYVYVVRGARKKDVSGQGKEVHELAEPHLAKWIVQARDVYQSVTINSDSFLFFSTRYAGGRRPVSVRAWYAILQLAYERAGVRGGMIGTHTLRKTYAERVYRYYKGRADAGENIDVMKAVQIALGHKSIENTYKYISFIFSEVDGSIFNV